MAYTQGLNKRQKVASAAEVLECPPFSLEEPGKNFKITGRCHQLLVNSESDELPAKQPHRTSTLESIVGYSNVQCGNATFPGRHCQTLLQGAPPLPLQHLRAFSGTQFKLRDSNAGIQFACPTAQSVPAAAKSCNRVHSQGSTARKRLHAVIDHSSGKAVQDSRAAAALVTSWEAGCMQDSLTAARSALAAATASLPAAASSCMPRHHQQAGLTQEALGLVHQQVSMVQDAATHEPCHKPSQPVWQSHAASPVTPLGTQDSASLHRAVHDVASTEGSLLCSSAAFSSRSMQGAHSGCLTRQRQPCKPSALPAPVAPYAATSLESHHVIPAKGSKGSCIATAGAAVPRPAGSTSGPGHYGALQFLGACMDPEVLGALAALAHTDMLPFRQTNGAGCLLTTMAYLFVLAERAGLLQDLKPYAMLTLLWITESFCSQYRQYLPDLLSEYKFHCQGLSTQDPLLIDTLSEDIPIMVSLQRHILQATNFRLWVEESDLSLVKETLSSASEGVCLSAFHAAVAARQMHYDKMQAQIEGDQQLTQQAQEHQQELDDRHWEQQRQQPGSALKLDAGCGESASINQHNRAMHAGHTGQQGIGMQHRLSRSSGPLSAQLQLQQAQAAVHALSQPDVQPATVPAGTAAAGGAGGITAVGQLQPLQPGKQLVLGQQLTAVHVSTTLEGSQLQQLPKQEGTAVPGNQKPLHSRMSVLSDATNVAGAHSAAAAEGSEATAVIAGSVAGIKLRTAANQPVMSAQHAAGGNQSSNCFAYSCVAAAGQHTNSCRPLKPLVGVAAAAPAAVSMHSSKQQLLQLASKENNMSSDKGDSQADTAGKSAVGLRSLLAQHSSCTARGFSSLRSFASRATGLLLHKSQCRR